MPMHATHYRHDWPRATCVQANGSSFVLLPHTILTMKRSVDFVLAAHGYLRHDTKKLNTDGRRTLDSDISVTPISQTAGM